jgi:hypothetical protein
MKHTLTGRRRRRRRRRRRKRTLRLNKGEGKVSEIFLTENHAMKAY